MSLGKMLATNLAENAAEKQRKEAQEAAKQNAQKAEERRKREICVTMIQNEIVACIKNQKEPRVKIKDYYLRDWMKKATKGQTADQDLWNDFITWATQEELRIDILDEHDGIGMEAWNTVTASPAPHI